MTVQEAVHILSNFPFALSLDDFTPEGQALIHQCLLDADHFTQWDAEIRVTLDG